MSQSTPPLRTHAREAIGRNVVSTHMTQLEQMRPAGLSGLRIEAINLAPTSASRRSGVGATAPAVDWYVKMIFMSNPVPTWRITKTRSPYSKAIAAVAALVFTGLALTACGGGSGATSEPRISGAPLKVVTAFYPLQYAAEQVGGDQVTVTNLTPPGVEPHDLELTPAQVAEIQNADLVLFVPGFQPAVDEAIRAEAGDKAVDVTSGINLLAPDPTSSPGSDEDSNQQDPHVWLDPANMSAIGATVAKSLSAADPADQQEFDRRQTQFATAMTDLSKQFSDALRSCTVKDMVVSHEAFAYLAKAVGLTQVGISGLSPDSEPSPARLAQVAELVKAQGVTTIYYETLVDPKVAKTLADETGATAAVLDPLEGLVPGTTGDYVSIMQSNLKTLQQGQVCP
ncbi:MAG: zinc transport system substrate-binding protein [Actinomycetota bacterium]|nr:zinc transport system substrate-binding protein [Actinomycetota bacterium]